MKSKPTKKKVSWQYLFLEVFCSKEDCINTVGFLFEGEKIYFTETWRLGDRAACSREHLNFMNRDEAIKLMKNKTNKQLYCCLCGTMETSISSGVYDRCTGKLTYNYVCPNKNCERGCEQNGGHDYKIDGIRGFITSQRKCKKCGDIDFGYSY